MLGDKREQALGYWTIGLQYLHLVEAVISETVAQRNVHIVVSDSEYSWDQYEKNTKWSDHRLIVPVLFDFYHGVEVILKGFLVAVGKPAKTNHKLSLLTSEFEDCFPGYMLGAIARKYIAQDQLPELLTSFCKTSGITIDDYYQALKYPQSTCGSVYKHYPLKYKGEDSVPFFQELAKDIAEAVRQTVALGRFICPSVSRRSIEVAYSGLRFASSKPRYLYR